jgi:hypothetical protein
VATNVTAEWAFDLLRPVLKQLNVQNLEETPVLVRATGYANLIAAGMERWVIIACQSSCQNGAEGFLEIVWDEKHDLFLLIINVNKDLFVNNEQSLRAQRKRIAIHELVHGFAYMFMSVFLTSGVFIQIMDQYTDKKVIMFTSAQFGSMLSAIGILGSKADWLFSDGHFRLFGDGFAGNYSELNINLLLSYQLLVETITAIKREKEKTGDIIHVPELLSLTLNELVEKKALDKDFVRGRMTQFLPMLYAEFL